MPDREGRRGDLLGDAQRSARTADQGGLAGAELAAYEDDVTGGELAGDALADRLSSFRAVGPLGQPPKRPIWSGSGSC